MDPIRTLHPLARAWLLDGPLSPALDAYLALLERGPYAEGSVEKHLRTLAHFSHWMTRCRLAVEQLDEDFVDQFLNHHLPRCDCHATVLRTRGDLSAGLGHLATVLRLQRVIAQPPSPTGPVAEELCRYDAHMRDARGLAAGTRERRLSIVGQLLLWKSSGRAFAVGELQPEDLRSFIEQELTRVNTVSHATALASALRAHFRYRSICGDVVHALLGVIASPARWALATLPRALTPQEVQRLMTHCEQTRSSPRRLLAMVRLALDLGLRGGEIARLELCDIDWRAGTLTVKRTKSVRQDVLPLPAGRLHQGGGRCAAAPVAEHLADLRQARSTAADGGGLALVRERSTNAPMDLQARVQQYLTERRRLGFHLRSPGHALPNFARFVEASKHSGALTVELMAQWARQAQGGKASAETAARRLAWLRPFLRWLQQFEPQTEVPDDSTFGPIPGRVAPHIYQPGEIEALLQAARQLGPCDGLRAATYETLFGLIASAGLRISEAIALADVDVDLEAGVLTVRQTKFGKSRLVPVHPSVVAPLAAYRALRRLQVRTTPLTPFFVGSRGLRRGGPLGDRQVHRMFGQLRQQLGWVDRGGHGQPRVHDLRHSFAVRRLILWHEQGVDLDQRMLALSTYMGHVKISNTYWYLTGVPELMALAGARFERFADAEQAREFDDA